MTKTQEKNSTRDVAAVLQQMLANDADLAHLVEEESFNADVAVEIYTARQESGLSQAELANLVNTQQSVISRLENADYDGHSLTMLRRIAKALGKQLRVEFFAPQGYAKDCAAIASEHSNVMWKLQKPWQPKISINADNKEFSKAS